MNYPTTVPEQIFAGDSLVFKFSNNDYPANEYTGTITLSASTGIYSATATSQGADYVFDISTTITSAWALGGYDYQIYASKTGYRITLATGRLKVLANIGSSTTGIDMRGFARKIADALESIITNRATNEQMMLVSQNCGNLNVSYTADVFTEWQRWKSFAEQEEAAGKVASRLRGRQNIYARFV